MNARVEPPTRLRLAIGLSLAAHLCALGWLAVMLDHQLPRAEIDIADVPFPPIVLVRSERAARAAIHPLPPPAVVARRGAEHAAPAAVPPAAAAPHPIARATAVARRPAVRTRSGNDRPPAVGTAPATGTPSSAARAVVVEVPTPGASPTIGPAPSPPPTPAPPVPTAPPTDAPHAPGFGGLFSQNYPPAFRAPADLAAIRSRLGSPVDIRIDVDDGGRATAVAFVRPLDDVATAQAVRAVLLAARYVPADCNGLPCEGTLEIRY